MDNTTDSYNGRDIRTVTTEDLKVDAVRYQDERARRELERRGVNWRVYL